MIKYKQRRGVAMFFKKRKSLIALAVAFFAAVLLYVGVTLFTPASQTVRAMEIESGSFRVYNVSGIFHSGYDDITSAWEEAKSLSFDQIRDDVKTATVKMFEDATVTNTLSMNDWNYDVALDLNGHKLSVSSQGKSVIESGGTFTLKDSNPAATNDVISYAKGSSPQTVNVSGGVITGANGNAAVMINSGKFFMQGGTVAGNVSTSKMRAAVYPGSAFTMTGGAITENLNTAGGAGGVYVWRTSVKISGAVKIDGNSSCEDINGNERIAGNLGFDYGTTIVVNGALNDGAGNDARIGITFLSEDYTNGTKVTKDYSTHHSGEAADKYFYSDTSDKCPQLSVGEVAIYRHVRSGSYTVDGDKHYRICSACKQKLYEDHSYSASTGKCACGVMAKAIVTSTTGFKEFYMTVADAFEAANLNSDLTTPFTVKLFTDVTTESMITVVEGKNIILNLNGCEIKYTGISGSVIKSDGKLLIEDKGSGTHTIISPVSNESVTVDGGLITGGKSSLGGAVFVSSGGTFTMNGGTLAGNTSLDGHGGAVRNEGTFIFNNGKISHNKAGCGGGVCVCDGNFVMTNGEISYNESTDDGGGVFYENKVDGNKFTFSGGEISNNKAVTIGGGVHMFSGVMEMSGSAKISGNTAGDNGGGVYVNSTLNVDGAPKIRENTVNGNLNNIYGIVYNKIVVTGELTNGAHIGISGAGEVAVGFTQTTGKASDFFIADNPEYVCIYVSDGTAGTVNFVSAHTGGTATCVAAKICVNCGESYGEIDGNAHTLDKLVIESAENNYAAFDEFDLENAAVYTHCSDCDKKVEKLDASEITVTYGNGNCLHSHDTHISLSVVVGGQTIISDDYSVNVSKREVTIVWEYTTSVVSEESIWEWNVITDGSHFVYDGTSKSYRVRARFNGADNDPDKNKHYYRAVDDVLLIDGGKKVIDNAATYALSLDGSKFADYSFTNNSTSIQIKAYEITLSDAEVYHWTLGEDKDSLLRDAYVEESNGTVLYYDPVTGEADGRTKVKRSVVRYRGDNTGLNIVLNGGEIADLFAGAGKRTNIVYSGTTAVGAVGKYTAIATLTLNDKLNYKYTGEIAVADSRGMTIVISENGTKAVITKDWYVATINNGLLIPGSGEYSVGGWTFGDDVSTAVPALEHGDESFDIDSISQDDKRISFGLYTDVDMNEQIGETFYRYNFADYVNKSMPVGNYVLRVSVAEVKDADGLAYQAFTRTFTFAVHKGTLDVTDTLSGERFEYVYNGNVQLFDSEYEPTLAPLKYVSASDRIGIWKNSGYDAFYGEAYLVFHLARWQTEGGVGYEFVTRTQLENTLDRKQAPREVDTYVVQYKISALNYADYGGSTRFTVSIIKRQIAVPDDVAETLITEYIYQVPQNALYQVEGNAKFTQAGTHFVTLKLADADNYAWLGGDNVDGDRATVKLTLTMHDHVYGEWTVDKAPTCTAAGSRSKKCTLCNDEAEEEISALGHDIVRHEAKAATCTEAGWSAYETCSRCDHTTYKEIVAAGHKLAHVERKEATADTVGNIEYWACADCANYFSDEGGKTVITDKSSVELPKLTPEIPSKQGTSLSAGAVAGIVIACVIVALVAVYVYGYFFLYRKDILLKGKAFDVIFMPMNVLFKRKDNG